MAEKMCITLRPERIHLGGSSMKILDSHRGRYKIPYREIVSAFLSVPDRESGIYYEPDITDITRDMNGDLILYDTENSRWRIQMDLAESTAGNVLIDLAVHAPHILIGGQTWLDADEEEDFAEAVRMTAVMQTVNRAGEARVKGGEPTGRG